MNKQKLSTEDGSEFTVFYLSEQKKDSLEDKGFAGFSGWLGTQEIKSYEEKPQQFAGKVSDLYPSDVYQISIDDTIESDLVKDPVSGRIYKVKSLGGVIARLKETRVGDKNLNTDTIYAQMDLHGTEFLVAAEDLRKATEFEVEKYLEKSID